MLLGLNSGRGYQPGGGRLWSKCRAAITICVLRGMSGQFGQ
jgi:hypothetical protein